MNDNFADWGYGPDEEYFTRAAEAAADAAEEAAEGAPALVGAAEEDIPF